MQAQNENALSTERTVEFFSASCEKEFYKVLKNHKKVAIAFATQLEGRLAHNLAPTIPIDHLGDGVIELRINGSPAFRCVYTMKVPGRVTVLHTFAKTTEGSDLKNVRLAQKRAKQL